jgi:phage tail sheath gpL-like
MFQAQYFVRQMRAAITGAYPRAALTNVPAGINGFTSPQQITQLLIHEYQRMANMGLVENASLFSAYLVVERDAVDPNRVNILMRPDMVNQLRVVATLVETHLELDAEQLAAA